MEWLALAIWLIVAAIALPLGRHALDETSTLGTVAVLAAALWLASDRRPVSRAGQDAEEIDALLAGIVGPLFAGAALLSVFVALDVGMVS
jgi:hypothetical protein